MLTNNNENEMVIFLCIDIDIRYMATKYDCMGYLQATTNKHLKF